MCRVEDPAESLSAITGVEFSLAGERIFVLAAQLNVFTAAAARPLFPSPTSHTRAVTYLKHWCAGGRLDVKQIRAGYVL